MKYVGAGLALLLLSGCVGHGNWGASMPDRGSLKSAAWSAAKAPDVWLPVATAGLLIATDVDHKWSEDIASDQRFFDDPEGSSTDLKDLANVSYIVTGLLAPSRTYGDKVKGFAVGFGTIALEAGITEGLKQTVKRERPDGSNDGSFPSGHAAKAASRATMARYNLRYMDLPRWGHHAADWTLQGVALGTALGRVEVGKHHLSDVFVGYALGNFVARFMYEAFMNGSGEGVQLSFAPVDEGGAFTLTVPMR